jgi:CRISP-associated protein Cas1
MQSYVGDKETIMARSYYLTRAGRLSRKDNTLFFEPIINSAEENINTNIEEEQTEQEIHGLDRSELPTSTDTSINEMGDLLLEPTLLEENKETSEGIDSPVKVGQARTIPIEDVDSIWAFNELDLNARVLVFLSQHKIPVHLFNYYGFYAGTYYPRDYLHSGFLLVKQVRHSSNRRLRLIIAKEIITAALHNILRNVRYYSTRGIELQVETEAIQSEILRLESTNSISELMGCEGRARASYYHGFTKILRNEYEFNKRVRRPPDNIVNTLISFTNGLVYTTTLSQLYRTQLDPRISFLHEPGARRFSLALDLAEIFKPILADRLIFKLLNSKQLTGSNFAQDLNCCYLKESGKKIILKEWDSRLQTTIEHRRLHRKVSYERLIRLECYKLVKHLTNAEKYSGFKAWW